jgi:predicted PP-loop superfamily ATPase
VINALTTNPNAEKVSSIPALSSGETNYKDFKVQFNGGVESKSSVKSFKWLSNCDTSALDALTVKEQVQSAKTVVTEAYQEKKQAYQENLQEQKEQAQQSKEQVQSAVEGLKNLKNLLK